MTITIMNLHKASTKAIRAEQKFRCDRRSPVGNPFQITPQNTRAEACHSYIEYFEELMKLNGNAKKYVDKMIEAYKKYGRLYLYCWCAPKQCHVETIKSYILEKCNEHATV